MFVRLNNKKYLRTPTMHISEFDAERRIPVSNSFFFRFNKKVISLYSNIIHFLNLFLSAQCNVQNTRNFTNYIKFLKVAQNTATRNKDLIELLYVALLRFVKKPSLFDNNYHDLIEVDALHRNLHEMSHHYSYVDSQYIGEFG